MYVRRLGRIAIVLNGTMRCCSTEPNDLWIDSKCLKAKTEWLVWRKLLGCSKRIITATTQNSARSWDSLSVTNATITSRDSSTNVNSVELISAGGAASTGYSWIEDICVACSLGVLSSNVLSMC